VKELSSVGAQRMNSGSSGRMKEVNDLIHSGKHWKQSGSVWPQIRGSVDAFALLHNPGDRFPGIDIKVMTQTCESHFG